MTRRRPPPTATRPLTGQELEDALRRLFHETDPIPEYAKVPPELLAEFARRLPASHLTEALDALEAGAMALNELPSVRLLRDQLSRDASDARRQLGIARASVVRLDDERRVLRGLLQDLVDKAAPHGPEVDEPGGPYVGAYLLPTGPVHRALAFLRDGAVPAALARKEAPSATGP